MSERGKTGRANEFDRFGRPSRTKPEGTGAKFTSYLLTGVVSLRDRLTEQVRKPFTDGGVGAVELRYSDSHEAA